MMKHLSRKRFLSAVALGISFMAMFAILSSVGFADWYGSGKKQFWPVEDNGAVPVNIQDQTTEVIDLYICNHGVHTHPTAVIAEDVLSFTVEDITEATLYQAVGLLEDAHAFQSIITDITGSTVTIGSPTDYQFSTDAEVVFGDWDLSLADGSTTEVVYYVQPPVGAVWDIYEIIVSIEDNAVMYESTFGGIPQLTNGIAGRIVNGESKQLFYISNNGGWLEYGFDTVYPAKVPSGTYAFRAIKNYSQKNGVALRLHGDTYDRLEIPVRDDLTGLEKMAISIHGHTTTD